MRPACVKFTSSPHGTVGCTLGLAPHLYVGAYGENAAAALTQAGELAAQLQERLDSDPELAAALSSPSGNAAAYRALSRASAMYYAGAQPADVERNVGPAAARVVSRLLRAR